jgi:ATP-binding cassette subfamily B protein
VRFGRALVRQGVRLVLLDEPFRGLDRQRRRDLLARAREIWHAQTLLCVTHDIEETLAFDRVLVLEHGQIVEDGDPNALASIPDSAYASLLAAEREVRSTMWSDRTWRHWRLEDGAIVEGDPETEQSWNELRRASPGQ